MTQVEIYKKSAVTGMEIFLRNFSKVPEDRLNWTPSPAAKSPIRIAAHTALYSARFAEMIETRQAPQPEDLDAWLEQRDSEELAVTDRREVERIFREGTARVLAALDTLTPEELDGVVDSGQGWTMPMSFLLGLPGWHATLHCGQIDYLQTCWGDPQVYIE